MTKEIEIELMPTGEIRLDRKNGKSEAQRMYLLQLLSGITSGIEMEELKRFLEDMDKIETLIGDISYCG